MRYTKFAVLIFFAFILCASCKHKGESAKEIPSPLSISICGFEAKIENGEAHATLQGVQNIKASDIKVNFSAGAPSQNVKMKPSLIFLKEKEITQFEIENVEGSEYQFNIKVSVTLKEKEEVLHNGDLRIWVATYSSDKKEAEEAIPSDDNLKSYIFESPWKLEEEDISKIWVLYKKEPEAELKSESLVYVGKADGNEALPIHEPFPAQGKMKAIPLYISTSEGPKVYELVIKTKVASDAENANIKNISFNGKEGIIEGRNIRCESVFDVGSSVNVNVEMEVNGARYEVNSGNGIIIENSGASFSIVTFPKNKAAMSKTYNVQLDAPPSLCIKKVLYLNHGINESPSVSNLHDGGTVEMQDGERFVTLPLYTASESVALHFELEGSSEIANVFMLKKNVWKRLDSYSSSRKILTLREGNLPLPPSLSNVLNLKLVLKDGSYDVIKIKFKKSENLSPIKLVGLYINDVEIESNVITSYFDGSLPLVEAKGPRIFVDIVSKEALQVTIGGNTYKSVYSGFLSYGLSFPVEMPKVSEEKNVDVVLECDYATSPSLRFRLKRVAGAVPLRIYPSINGQLIGEDTLAKFIDGSEPLILVAGEEMFFSIDEKYDVLASVAFNGENMEKNELTDGYSGAKFYRWEVFLKDLKVGDIKTIKVEAKPKDEIDYLPLIWKFKVKRER